MPNFHRWRIAGASYFFTSVTAGRRPLFWNQVARALLSNTIRECRAKWDFGLDAIVLLPDHWHVLITLPPGDDEYPKRMGWIKKEFTKAWLNAGGKEVPVTHSQKQLRRRGVWQPRFWEHTIRDDEDFEAHVNYIHYNPVKHGYVSAPADWKWSSFIQWVDKAAYTLDWGTGIVTLPANMASRDFGE